MILKTIICLVSDFPLNSGWLMTGYNPKHNQVGFHTRKTTRGFSIAIYLCPPSHLQPQGFAHHPVAATSVSVVATHPRRSDILTYRPVKMWESTLFVHRKLPNDIHKNSHEPHIYESMRIQKRSYFLVSWTQRKKQVPHVLPTLRFTDLHLCILPPKSVHFRPFPTANRATRKLPNATGVVPAMWTKESHQRHRSKQYPRCRCEHKASTTQRPGRLGLRF